MPPIIDQEKCVGCGTCADICNSMLFTFDREKDRTPQVAFPEECWHCNSCVIDCSAGAVTLRLPLPYTLLHIDAKNLHTREAC